MLPRKYLEKQGIRSHFSFKLLQHIHFYTSVEMNNNNFVCRVLLYFNIILYASNIVYLVYKYINIV